MLTIKQFASIPGGNDLTALYRARVGDYPKFFKMDTACKLGFLLAEQLPSLFVYTLPNIITGEIAIRNKYEGETSAYVLERFDPGTFVALVEQAFQDMVTASALCGWVDCRADDDFTAFAFLVERDGNGKEFNVDNLYGTVNQ